MGWLYKEEPLENINLLPLRDWVINRFSSLRSLGYMVMVLSLVVWAYLGVEAYTSYSQKMQAERAYATFISEAQLGKKEAFLEEFSTLKKLTPKFSLLSFNHKFHLLLFDALPRTLFLKEYKQQAEGFQLKGWGQSEKDLESFLINLKQFFREVELHETHRRELNQEYFDFTVEGKYKAPEGKK